MWENDIFTEFTIFGVHWNTFRFPTYYPSVVLNNEKISNFRHKDGFFSLFCISSFCLSCHVCGITIEGKQRNSTKVVKMFHFVEWIPFCWWFLTKFWELCQWKQKTATIIYCNCHCFQWKIDLIAQQREKTSNNN